MNGGVTISTYEFLKRFPTEREARTYVEQCRWHGHPTCPTCGSTSSRGCARAKGRTAKGGGGRPPGPV